MPAKYEPKPTDRIPTNLRILGHLIDIEVVPEEEVEDDEHLHLDPDDQGAYLERMQRIWIRDGMAWDATRETLLHEVVHAVEQGLGLGLSENKVNALGRALLQVLRENPELFDFIRG